MTNIKTKKLHDLTMFVNEKICPDCGGDGYFEIVVPQENHIVGTQEIFEKEECQKCTGKGVLNG